MHAAGVTLDCARVEEFRERFNAYAAQRLHPEDFLPCWDVDAVLELRDIDNRSVDGIFALAPFGHGQEPPCFAALNVEVAAAPGVVKEKHLRVPLRQNGRLLVFIAWNFVERAAEFSPGSRVDVVFQLEQDPYSASRGYPGWSAVLRDVRPAATPCTPDAAPH
jgi:single-stranded-DNA-specific exonuclease